MPKRLKLRRQDRGAYGGHGVYMGGSRDRRRARSSPHTVSAKKHESEEAKRKRKKHSQSKDAKRGSQSRFDVTWMLREKTATRGVADWASHTLAPALWSGAWSVMPLSRRV